MPFFINNLICDGCGNCKSACPADAIHETNSTFVIDSNLCLSCGGCKQVCRRDAIAEPCSVA